MNGIVTFFAQLTTRFEEIGAIAPSSPSLARLMTKQLSGPRKAFRILEVGSGTGPMTRQILKQLRPEDTFIVCDVNEKLLTSLEHSIRSDTDFTSVLEQVQFYCGPVQELEKSNQRQQFDLIVCSLPFANFSPVLAEEIMSCLHRLLSKEGTLSFFQYVMLQPLALLVSTPANRARLRGVRAVLKRWLEEAERHGSVNRNVSLLNLPPAVAIQMSF